MDTFHRSDAWRLAFSSVIADWNGGVVDCCHFEGLPPCFTAARRQCCMSPASYPGHSFALLLLKAQSPRPVMGLVASWHRLMRKIWVQFCRGCVNFFSQNSKWTSIEFSEWMNRPLLKLELQLAMKNVCWQRNVLLVETISLTSSLFVARFSWSLAQTANHMTLTQCIQGWGHGADASLEFTVSIRMGEKGDGSDFDCGERGSWCQTVWSDFYKLLIQWLVQPSLVNGQTGWKP